jgi:hypothetical protein
MYVIVLCAILELVSSVYTTVYLGCTPGSISLGGIFNFSREYGRGVCNRIYAVRRDNKRKQRL